MICDQWFDQWLIDFVLSIKSLLIHVLAMILLGVALNFFLLSLSFSLLQVKLYNQKRQDLEEQQLHLNIGLQKIRETVEQVEELQASLSIKTNELEPKNTLANQNLKQMVHDQQEAEKKITSQEIQEALKASSNFLKCMWVGIFLFSQLHSSLQSFNFL